jgi:cysteine desulfuration protein SufE
MTVDTIRSDFAFLDDWEDRYRYVIELGRGLSPFPEAYRTHRYKVRGCASRGARLLPSHGRGRQW